jgi:hypothetical protein
MSVDSPATTTTHIYTVTVSFDSSSTPHIINHVSSSNSNQGNDEEQQRRKEDEEQQQELQHLVEFICSSLTSVCILMLVASGISIFQLLHFLFGF